MPPALVQYNQTAGTNASLGLAYGSNTTTGNTLIAVASWKPVNGGAPTGVPTCTGATFVQDGASLADGGGNAAIQVWHAFGITGATTPTVTYHNDGGATVEFQILEVSVIDTLDQVSRTASGTGTTATPANLTTTKAVEFVLNVTAINPASSQFYSAGDGTFTDCGGGTGGTYLSQYKVTVSTGTFAPTATLNSSDTWVDWTSSYYKTSGSTFQPDEDYFIPLSVSA